MRYSQTLDYAISAVLELSQRSAGEPVSCTSLALSKKIPKRYLLQILRRLVSTGVLRSARGVEGGYALNLSSEHVTLLDLIDSIEMPFDIPDQFLCSFSPDTREQLLATLRESNDAQRDVLRRLTLADLGQTEKQQSRDRGLAC